MNFNKIAGNLPSLLKGRGKPDTRSAASCGSKKRRKSDVEEQEMLSESKRIEDAVEGMLELCNVNDDDIADTDIDALMKSNDLLLEQATTTERMYTRYQNLWHDFKRVNGIQEKDEMDDMHLRDF